MKNYNDETEELDRKLLMPLLWILFAISAIAAIIKIYIQK